MYLYDIPSSEHVVSAKDSIIRPTEHTSRHKMSRCISVEITINSSIPIQASLFAHARQNRYQYKYLVRSKGIPLFACKLFKRFAKDVTYIFVYVHIYILLCIRYFNSDFVRPEEHFITYIGFLENF